MSYRLLPLLAALLATTTLPALALDLKDITYTTDSAGKVVFSHKTHLNKKKPKTAAFNCKACHTTAPDKKIRYTMADMEKGKSCGACHNGRQAFPLARCSTCHKVGNVAFRMKDAGQVVFSHDRHLKKMNCSACHNGLYRTGKNPRVGMAAMEKGKSCGACHDGRKAFAVASCSRCHPMKDKQYRLAIGNVRFSHSAHTDTYACGDCHGAIYTSKRAKKPYTMTDMEKGESCGACHDGKTAFTVTGLCSNCHSKTTS